VCIWNKTKKRNPWGSVKQKKRPTSDWIKTPVEHLRIIDAPLWARVQSRRDTAASRAIRFSNGRLSGRPPKSETKKPAGWAGPLRVVWWWIGRGILQR